MLLGDMNINIIGNNKVDNNYHDLLISNGFISLTNIFTRIPVNGNNHCIAHTFVKSNKINDNIEAGVLHTDFSDYYGVKQNSVSLENINYEK